MKDPIDFEFVLNVRFSPGLNRCRSHHNLRVIVVNGDLLIMENDLTVILGYSGPSPIKRLCGNYNTVKVKFDKSRIFQHGRPCNFITFDTLLLICEEFDRNDILCHGLMSIKSLFREGNKMITKISIVDESGKSVYDNEIRGQETPRIGETIKVVRYIPGNTKVVDGKRVGIEWFSAIDRIDVYKVIDVEHTIRPSFNSSTIIEIKVIVKLVSVKYFCEICGIEVNHKTGMKVKIEGKEQVMCVACDNLLFHALPYNTKKEITPLPETGQ